MEYLNFELKIGIKNNGLYPVTVIRSPAGETNAMVSFPVTNRKFKNKIQYIEKLRVSELVRDINLTTEDVTRDIVLEFDEFEEVDGITKTLGSELFDTLFPNEIRSCFRSSLSVARQEKKGLRILLRIEAPELAGLPWEFLYDEAEGDHFCLTTELPLVRFIELARPPEILTAKPPLNILAVIASPTDLPPLQIETEKAQMNAAVEGLVDKGLLTITWLEGQSWRTLQASMRKGSWHILHFIGHGGFDSAVGEGAIALANEDGSTYLLSATDLGRLLAGHQSMRLVVLNSCEGARSSETNLFSSIGANLIRRGIPAVISMQYAITDRAALEFSRTFYDTIVEGIPVDAATKEARKSINFALKDNEEWATPVLHLRAKHGQLFNIDINSALFSEGSRMETAPWKKAVPPAEPIYATSLNEEDDRGLNILKDKVQKFWVEGVLEQSLQHSALIKLDLDTMPTMVDSPWGSLPIETNQTIGTIFNQVGRSMLILGEPGAGKTTLLLSLAKELLQQYQQLTNFPLPVVFNLSSWTHSGKKLGEWLADELSMKYMIPKRFGQSWLKDNRLLLLLDGLDEVGTEKRNECVQVVNEFIQKTAIMGVILCCRFREYIELDTKLTVNAAIRLRLLSKEKILGHLENAGAVYSGLSQLLQRDSSFLKLAETPFMLSLMMLAFQNLNPNQFTGNEMILISNKKSYLLEAYVNRQFRLVKKGAKL